MSSEGKPFLDVVASLGHEIADAAIWFGGCCNWVGARTRGHSWSSGSPSVEALGPDLYGGTSGVALFLAEAAVNLDDERLRTTALGAIRHSLKHAADIGLEAGDGLYDGLVGIAYSATRVAEVLGTEEVATDALTLLSAWRHERTHGGASDVMQGLSGAVVGLAALSASINEPWLVDTAAELGDELAARAQATPQGWSWPAPGAGDMHNLCGYAHGAAGTGHAFVELYALTGEGRFRRGAVRAFDYERSWIDGRTGVWPDLRGVTRRTGRDAPLVSATSWCNGVTGIALSRLRAAEVIHSEDLTRDAELGLGICKAHALELLALEPDDFSLCHGAAGSGDALLTASATSDDTCAVLAADVGRLGVEHTSWRGAPGLEREAPEGRTPGLLLGLAGIGMFYLRLVDPGVGSPLLVSRPLDRLTGHYLQS